MQRGQNVAWKRFGDSRNSCTTIFQAGKYLERVHTGHITTRQTDSTRMTLKWRVGHGKRVFFSGCGWLKAPRQQILRAKGSLVILLRALGLTTTWVWLFFFRCRVWCDLHRKSRLADFFWGQKLWWICPREEQRREDFGQFLRYRVRCNLQGFACKSHQTLYLKNAISGASCTKPNTWKRKPKSLLNARFGCSSQPYLDK